MGFKIHFVVQNFHVEQKPAHTYIAQGLAAHTVVHYQHCQQDSSFKATRINSMSERERERERERGGEGERERERERERKREREGEGERGRGREGEGERERERESRSCKETEDGRKGDSA